MTALNAYTQYETLVFLQSIARNGSDRAAFERIATVLVKNQIIRSSNYYDEKRFQPDALRDLYDELVVKVHRNVEKRQSHTPPTIENGNPRKRKLSTSPPRTTSPSEQQFVQGLVEGLYRKFREDTVADLRHDEAIYAQLQKDIDKLEGKQVKPQRKPSPPVVNKDINTRSSSQRPSPPKVALTDPNPGAQLQADYDAAATTTAPRPETKPTPSPEAHSISQPTQAIPVHALIDHPQTSSTAAVTAPAGNGTPRSASGTPQMRATQPPPPPPPPPSQPVPAQHHSPGSFNRTLPPPSPQSVPYVGPIQQPHSFAQSTTQVPPHMLPPIHNLQRTLSYEHLAPPSAQNQGRASPLSSQQPQYATYNQPYPPPPAGWQQARNTPSHSMMPQGNVQQYPTSSGTPQPPYAQSSSRYPAQSHTPPPPPSQQHYQYPHTAPYPYVSQQQWRGPSVPPYYPHSYSANTTPVPRPSSRTSLSRSASVTPWKRKSLPARAREPSPSRLAREVSPLSDRGSPLPKREDEETYSRESASPGPASHRQNATPALDTSRSQSVASVMSEAPVPQRRPVGRPPKVRADAPVTPAPTPPEHEASQRSSGRRGRPRTNTNLRSDLSRTNTVTKRKRETPSQSPAPTRRPNAVSLTSIRDKAQHADPTLAVVSKSFSKTSQLLLNDILAHKLAGIFAKPLSERDAPGYKSLVHRPQDLKSIKAAISKGSRIATAAIEDLESNLDATDNTNIVDDSETIDATKEGPLGGGFYLVRATEDLIPPRGIVNSSQLETELVRMFANAIMFNPLPTPECGFGRSLRLRKRGGEVASGLSFTNDDHQQGRDDSEESTSLESESSGTSDEQGIISDAREMYRDVAALVSRWRKLEVEKINTLPSGLPGPSSSTLSTPIVDHSSQGVPEKERHASISASSAAADDDREGTPTTTRSRKRRKIDR